MGTNYYFVFRTEHESFLRDYLEKEDFEYYKVPKSERQYMAADSTYPLSGFEIHLNKLSGGWKPLFQIHSTWNSFKQLEEFYYQHHDYLMIFDEYKNEYSFDEYKKIIINHSKQLSKSLKFIKRNASFFYDIEECDENEAELFTPIDHQTYEELSNKYNIIKSEYVYNKDPDYNFDWVKGDFA